MNEDGSLEGYGDNLYILYDNEALVLADGEEKGTQVPRRDHHQQR